MKITDIEIRACRKESDKESALRHDARVSLDYLAIRVATDEGITAEMFGFAGRNSKATAEMASGFLKPFFLGRNPLYRERHWRDFRDADRMWHHAQIYSYGPFDILCWLLSAKAAGQPLYQYIGAVRDEVPCYASSMYFDTAEAYAKEALELKQAGWAGYKLHPPKDYAECLRAHQLCRQAVGPDFILMSDPVGNFNLEQNRRLARELEKLGYYWLEEPLYDEFVPALRELTRKVNIPVVSGEVMAKHPYSVAESIATRAFDIVRADVSWSGGVTAVMKTAHLAESFGMQCEVHTAVFEPLDLVNLHCCAALNNCEFFEVLLPRETFSFGLKEPIDFSGGVARLPQEPGLGVELDWDEVENSTIKIY